MIQASGAYAASSHFIVPNCDPVVLTWRIDGFDVSRFPVSPLAKSTRSNLEFDTQAYQILNRHLMTARSVPPILEIPPALPTLPNSTTGCAPTSTPEPLVHSIRELWDAERARRASLGLDPSPLMPVEATPSQRGPGREGCWEGSQRHNEELQARIEAEKGEWEPKEKLEMWECLAWTTLESTEMLWGPQWRTIRKEPQEDHLVRDPQQELSDSPHPDGQPVNSQGSSSNPFESSPDAGEEETSHKGKELPSSVDFTIVSSQAVATTIDQEKAFEQGDVLPPSRNGPSGRGYTESKTPQKSIVGCVKISVTSCRCLSQPFTHQPSPYAAPSNLKIQLLARLAFSQTPSTRVRLLRKSGAPTTFLMSHR
jgi:hypothetical protein